jgi:uncharacterized protein YciI
MDGYATAMIARGPTVASDGDTATGSVHIVDLPDPSAARAFAFDEPNNQAGVYRDVLLRRGRTMLGRTRRQSPAFPIDDNGYLVIGLGPLPTAKLLQAPDHDTLIAYGSLLSDDGTSWLGTAALLTAPDPATASSILAGDTYSHVELHHWRAGGRPS